MQTPRNALLNALIFVLAISVSSCLQNRARAGREPSTSSRAETATDPSTSPSPPAVPSTPALPNIVLIISDDQGWTDYSFMGHPHVRTPRLDRLSAESLVFRRGYVPSSLCCPSLASIITGLYPHQHKVTSNDPPIPPGMKPAQFYASGAFREGRETMTRHLEAVPTLPRLLGDKGYFSLQTGKWWQGDFRRGGFTHGMTRGTRHGDEGLKIGRETMKPIHDFIAEARKAARPFFIWYAPFLPHDPHNPPERLLAKYRDKAPSLPVARYWAMVEWFDETCGQLLDHIDGEGLREETIVIYVTDNGWIQGQRGFAPKSKTSPYDGGIRTPIMIRWPGKVAPRESSDLALSIDIAPTILALIGEKPTSAMPGVSLVDKAATSARERVQGACFTHNAVDLDDPAKNLLWRWIIDGHWKLIVPERAVATYSGTERATGRKAGRASGPASEAAPGGAEASGAASESATTTEAELQPELYDLAADPHEERDLAAEEPARVKAMRKKLDAWWNPGS